MSTTWVVLNGHNLYKNWLTQHANPCREFFQEHDLMCSAPQHVVLSSSMKDDLGTYDTHKVFFWHPLRYGKDGGVCAENWKKISQYYAVIAQYTMVVRQPWSRPRVSELYMPIIPRNSSFFSF